MKGKMEYLIRSDHPSDSKKGGICIYYKKPIILLNHVDVCTLDKCLVTKICSQNEKCFLTSIYCSPSQNHDGFCANFDTLLNNIHDEFVHLSQVILMLAVPGGGKII